MWRKNKENIILVSLAILAVGVLVVLLVFFRGSKEESPAVSESSGGDYSLQQETTSYASLGGKNAEKGSALKGTPDSDDISEFIYNFLPPVIEPSASSNEDGFVAVEPPPPQPGEATGTEPEISKSVQEENIDTGEEQVPLTDEEIFHRLFPSYYIDGLSYYQDLLINTGYFSESDRLTFDSLDNVIEGLDRGLSYLLDVGTIDQEKYDRFKKSIHGEFRDLIMYEWEQLRTGASPYDMNKIKEGAYNFEDIWPPSYEALYAQGSCGSEEENIFKKVWGKIMAFIYPESAYAGGGCGFDPYGGVCIEGIECYRSGPPIPAGVDLWAPCCCCCAGKAPIGCLNSVCSGPRAAIWDPMTGICGCG